jgi:excisionase family DNA binding protein
MSVLGPKYEGRTTLTVDEVAEVLGVSRWTAYEAVHKHQLPVIKVGRRLLVPKAALEKMLDAPVAQPTT